MRKLISVNQVTNVRKLISCTIALLFIGCGKPAKVNVGDSNPTITPTKLTCTTSPEVYNAEFVGDPATLIDESLISALSTDTVVPGDARIVDIDYGCMWRFHEVELRNEGSNVGEGSNIYAFGEGSNIYAFGEGSNIYAFGTVNIYSAETRSGPWTFVTSFTQATANVEVDYNWTYEVDFESRYVRYELVNDSAADTTFTISDIESAATYERD